MKGVYTEDMGGGGKNRISYPFHYLLISQLTIYLLCVCYGPGTKDVRVK